MNGKTVLLVDDEDFAVTTLTMIFKALQVEVVVAKDGKQAVDTYTSKNGAFTFVLMDIHMPVMDGYEATKQIRNTEKSKGLPACKIIGLSGDGDQKTKDACLASGMNDLVVKPVKKDVLASFL